MPATTVGCCQRVLQWLKCFASKLQLAMCPITYLLLLLPCPMSKYIAPALLSMSDPKLIFPEFFRNRNPFSESVSLGSRIFCTQCWFYLNSHLWFWCVSQALMIMMLPMLSMLIVGLRNGSGGSQCKWFALRLGPAMLSRHNSSSQQGGHWTE